MWAVFLFKVYASFYIFTFKELKKGPRTNYSAPLTLNIPINSNNVRKKCWSQRLTCSSKYKLKRSHKTVPLFKPRQNRGSRWTRSFLKSLSKVMLINWNEYNLELLINHANFFRNHCPGLSELSLLVFALTWRSNDMNVYLGGFLSSRGLVSSDVTGSVFFFPWEAGSGTVDKGSEAAADTAVSQSSLEAMTEWEDP